MEKVEAYMARFEMGNDPIELDKVVAIPTMVAKDHNGKPLCLDKKTTVGFYHHFFLNLKDCSRHRDLFIPATANLDTVDGFKDLLEVPTVIRSHSAFINRFNIKSEVLKFSWDSRKLPGDLVVTVICNTNPPGNFFLA